jgi:hypothetical protein
MATELADEARTGTGSDPLGGPEPAVVRPAELTFLPVDLGPHYDNRAGSEAADTAAGGFNVWGNSFPAEHLPVPGQPWSVDGVPFLRSRPHAGGDNVRCAGQYVRLGRRTAANADWLHLVVAAERRTEAAMALHFDDGAVDFEMVRVSDFWAGAPAAFGDRLVVATPVMHYPHHVQPGVPAQLWAQRVPVTRRAPLAGVRLPRHVAVHVFALTVQTTRPAEEAR